MIVVPFVSDIHGQYVNQRHWNELNVAAYTDLKDAARTIAAEIMSGN